VSFGRTKNSLVPSGTERPKKEEQNTRKSRVKMKGTKGTIGYSPFFFLFLEKKKIRQSGKLWGRQAEERGRSSSATLSHYESIQSTLA
jgi:hypothetical protein